MITKLFRNSFLQNIGIYTFFTFLQKGISFILVPIYTSILGPAEFGLVGQVIAISNFYILLSNFALDEAIARFYFLYKENKNLEVKLGSIISLSITITIFISLLVWFLKSYIFINFIGDLSNKFVIASVIFIATSPIFSIYSKILRIKELVKAYSFISMFYCVTQIVFILFFLFIFKQKVLGYIFGVSLSSLIFGIISFYQLRNHTKLSRNLKIIKSSFKYSLSLVPHTISSWGLNGFSQIFLGKICGSFHVGIFNVMNYPALILNALSISILNSYQPWLYLQLESKNYNKIIKVIRLIAFFYIILGFILSLFSNEIFLCFISSDYHSGIIIIPILVFSSVVLNIGSLFVYFLYYDMKITKYVSFSTLFGVVLNVVISFFLVSKYTYIGTAIAIALSNFFISLIKRYYAGKSIHFSFLSVDLFIISLFNAVISIFAIIYSFNFFTKFVILTFELLVIIYINKPMLNKKNI